MQRYLFHLGYCGSRLRGIQRQSAELEELRGSVQGLLEKGLTLLDPANEPLSYFSSRTDKGSTRLHWCHKPSTRATMQWGEGTSTAWL